MQPAPDGEVYVLNNLSGELRRSVEGRLNGPNAELATGNCYAEYPHIGFRINARYRTIGERVYYVLDVWRLPPTGRTLSQEKWVQYVGALGDDAGMRLLLQTSDGFELREQAINFEDTTGIVDSKGIRQSFQASASLELDKERARALGNCSIGYFGLFPVERYLDPDTQAPAAAN